MWTALLKIVFYTLLYAGAREARHFRGNVRLRNFGPCKSMGELGLDASQLVSVADLKAFRDKGYSFMIFRGYRSLGKIDENGVQSVKNAAAAGFQDVAIYIFPQVKKEKSPNEQIKEMLAAFEGTEYNSIWLDVEEPNRKLGDYWNPPDEHGSLVKNRIFFEGLLEEARKSGKTVGVYSDKQSWNMIMGEDYTGGSDCPLWFACWDKKTSFDSFQPFGGWKEPAMKQIEGDTTVCGVSVDRNWRK